MCFSSPSPPKLPPPVAVETPVDQSGQAANEALRKRLRGMSGYSSTSLTGGGGTGTPNVGKTTLGA